MSRVWCAIQDIFSPGDTWHCPPARFVSCSPVSGQFLQAAKWKWLQGSPGAASPFISMRAVTSQTVMHEACHIPPHCDTSGFSALLPLCGTPSWTPIAAEGDSSCTQFSRKQHILGDNILFFFFPLLYFPRRTHCFLEGKEKERKDRKGKKKKIWCSNTCFWTFWFPPAKRHSNLQTGQRFWILTPHTYIYIYHCSQTPKWAMGEERGIETLGAQKNTAAPSKGMWLFICHSYGTQGLGKGDFTRGLWHRHMAEAKCPRPQTGKTKGYVMLQHAANHTDSNDF